MNGCLESSDDNFSNFGHFVVTQCDLRKSGGTDTGATNLLLHPCARSSWLLRLLTRLLDDSVFCLPHMPARVFHWEYSTSDRCWMSETMVTKECKQRKWRHDHRWWFENSVQNYFLGKGGETDVLEKLCLRQNDSGSTLSVVSTSESRHCETIKIESQSNWLTLVNWIQTFGGLAWKSTFGWDSLPSVMWSAHRWPTWIKNSVLHVSLSHK